MIVTMTSFLFYKLQSVNYGNNVFKYISDIYSGWEINFKKGQPSKDDCKTYSAGSQKSLIYNNIIQSILIVS